MSEIRQMTAEQKAEWARWVRSRPPVIQDLATRYGPTTLYRLKSSGHRCTIYSYAEDGTMTVKVTGEYNRVLFGRNVFGVEPDDLEECDPPGPDEDVGDTSMEAGYSNEDVQNILIPKLRERMKR